MLGRGHELGTWVFEDARCRPLLQRVLRQFLGQAHVLHNARQAGDQLGRLDVPDGINGAVGFMRFGGGNQNDLAW